MVATRDDQGDVCIVRQDLWRERMFANLGNPMDSANELTCKGLQVNSYAGKVDTLILMTRPIARGRA